MLSVEFQLKKINSRAFQISSSQYPRNRWCSNYVIMLSTYHSKNRREVVPENEDFQELRMSFIPSLANINCDWQCFLSPCGHGQPMILWWKALSKNCHFNDYIYIYNHIIYIYTPLGSTVIMFFIKCLTCAIYKTHQNAPTRGHVTEAVWGQSLDEQS